MIDPFATHNPFSTAYDASAMMAPPDGTRATPDRAAARPSPAERLLVRIPESSIVTLAGGMAGAVSGVVSCPLDVIKTKLQAQGGFRRTRNRGPGAGGTAAALSTATYRGVKGTAQTIFREEGVRGLYRGLGPMLLGYIPTWAVYLTVYNEAQRYFCTKTGQ